MHYQTRYEERHQPLDETGEAEMINSFEPSHCPFCGSAIKVDQEGNVNVLSQLPARYLTHEKLAYVNG